MSTLFSILVIVLSIYAIVRKKDGMQTRPGTRPPVMNRESFNQRTMTSAGQKVSANREEPYESQEVHSGEAYSTADNYAKKSGNVIMDKIKREEKQDAAEKLTQQRRREQTKKLAGEEGGQEAMRQEMQDSPDSIGLGMQGSIMTSNMQEVYDLMVKGYTVNLPEMRDFSAEGLMLLDQHISGF